MSRVVILGCGPAGLLAAHAVEQAGHTPVILSRKQKSTIPGSQYMHEPIPGLHSPYPENTVQYVRMGTAEGYAEKVYGDPARPTGWEAYNQLYPSWNVPKMYDRLWERFEDRINEWSIPTGPEHDSVLSAQAALDLAQDEGDLVISTLPAQLLCYGEDEHFFDGSPYWIQTLPTPPIDLGRDIVIYNGRVEDPWYRWSILGDVCSIEYAAPRREDDHHHFSFKDDVIVGTKAVYTNCDCWPKIVRAGRWAQWRHGVLLHHAYRAAEAAARRLS